MEKGAKSIVALQHTLHGTDFVPRVHGHRVEKLVDSIEPGFVLPTARIARMREVAQAFGSGHSVGKYQVDTGGGFGMGLDWMRPLDCYAKIVFDVFWPRLAGRGRGSLLNRLISETDDSLDQAGFRTDDMRRALFWRNPVFVPDWEARCEQLVRRHMIGR